MYSKGQDRCKFYVLFQAYFRVLLDETPIVYFILRPILAMNPSQFSHFQSIININMKVIKTVTHYSNHSNGLVKYEYYRKTRFSFCYTKIALPLLLIHSINSNGISCFVLLLKRMEGFKTRNNFTVLIDVFLEASLNIICYSFEYDNGTELLQKLPLLRQDKAGMTERISCLQEPIFTQEYNRCLLTYFLDLGWS